MVAAAAMPVADAGGSPQNRMMQLNATELQSQLTDASGRSNDHTHANDRANGSKASEQATLGATVTASNPGATCTREGRPYG